MSLKRHYIEIIKTLPQFSLPIRHLIDVQNLFFPLTLVLMLDFGPKCTSEYIL